jgi:rhodanese-related sulfurtransferase
MPDTAGQEPGKEKAGQGVKPRLFFVLALAVAGILPLLLFWTATSKATAIEPDQVEHVLALNHESVLLVDIRVEDEFAKGNIQGSVNWPYRKIKKLASGNGIPPEFKDKKLFLICNIGISSAQAAKKLSGLGLADVFSVKGGMENWLAAGRCKLPALDNGLGASGRQEVNLTLSPALQWATVLTAFGVKPFYMILSLLIALWLRRQRSPDLVALKWAMLFFFSGELFCAVNYLFFTEGSHLAEYLHMFGMAVAFGLIVLALIEFLDDRLIRFSDPGVHCALLSACGKCYKNAAVACSLRVIFTIAAPCLIFICAMPLLAEPRPILQNVLILGTPYAYSHSLLYQLFETRCAPAAAACFFAIAFLLMLLRKERSLATAKLFFAGGSGFLGFGMFRLILFSLYRDNLAWFVIWEELTELILVAATGLFLLVFRKKPLLIHRHP